MSDEKPVSCRNCGTTIYYDEGLQSWRHEATHYDTCQPFWSPRRYATPGTPLQERTKTMTDADERWWCPRCDAECNRHRPAPIPDAAPNEYSPEAVAAIPDRFTQVFAGEALDPHVLVERAVFDRGMKAGRDAALTEAAARAEDFRSGNYDRPDDWTEYATACNVTADRIAQAIRHLREGTPNE